MIDFSKMRFLVVDDFSEFRSSIRGILGLLAVQHIDTAANGEDVMELCRRNRYDVILHDYNLGDGVNGQQVLERLHAEKLLAPHCIFIMVTAENTQAMVLAAIECEPDDYLSKPFSKVVLQTRLERMARRKRVLAPVLDAQARGDWAGVLQACAGIEADEPRHAALCQRHKAAALRNLGRFLELERELERQARSRPASWNLQMLARLWLQQGRDDKLTALLNAATRQFPLLPELHDIHAELAARGGDLSASVRHLQHAVSLSPNTIRRQVALARMAWLDDQPEVMAAAVRHCWEAGRHSVVFDPELLWQLAVVLAQGSGRNQEELQYWLRILQQRDMQTAALQPALTLLRLEQARLQGRKPPADETETAARAVTAQLQNLDVVTLLQLGDLLTGLEQPAAAAACWQACGMRHAGLAGVAEQLARRLPELDLRSALEAVGVGREAAARQALEQPGPAAELFAQALQHSAEQIEINMAAARLFAAGMTAGNGAAQDQLQQCLQRIGNLSVLAAEHPGFMELKNRLELRVW